jgi:hypothetical protein
VVAVWEDLRPSGKVQLINLYMQRYSDFTAGIKNGDPGYLPKKFTLYQNFPNPFNPSTKISFYLPEAGKVNLTIYNPLGQQVITLIDNNLKAGSHSITWNGECSNASISASGIYYYRLDLDGKTKVMKMLLLK